MPEPVAMLVSEAEFHGIRVGDSVTLTIQIHSRAG